MEMLELAVSHSIPLELLQCGLIYDHKSFAFMLSRFEHQPWNISTDDVVAIIDNSTQ